MATKKIIRTNPGLKSKVFAKPLQTPAIQPFFALTKRKRGSDPPLLASETDSGEC
jgi:hypothetical protein